MKEVIEVKRDDLRELYNEEEVVHALVGFIRQPQGRELLKRAASLSMLDSLMKSVLNTKEQEERK